MRAGIEVIPRESPDTLGTSRAFSPRQTVNASLVVDFHSIYQGVIMLASRLPTSNLRLCALASACALATLPFLAACDSSDSTKTVGQKLDTAIANTEQAAVDVKDATKASVDSAGAALREGADQAKAAAKEASASVNINSEDAAITASVAAGLIKDPDLSALKIDIDTKQGVVSLYGPAPSETARVRATDIAKAVKGVSGVENKLTVKTS
jgi:hyperosmotically inducible periplasmic protein